MQRQADILAWEEDPRVQALLQQSGVRIVALSRDNVAELKDMMQRNRKLDGFFQMDSVVFAGEHNRFDDILSQKQIDGIVPECLVALDDQDRVIGFVTFAFNDSGSNILELGVDTDAAYHKTKSHGPKNVGSLLLYAACNKILSHSAAKEVYVFASTSEVIPFYEKYGFRVDPDVPAGDELALQRSDYESAMKANVLARARRAQQVVTGTSASTFSSSNTASPANPTNESVSTSSMNKKH